MIFFIKAIYANPQNKVIAFDYKSQLHILDELNIEASCDFEDLAIVNLENIEQHKRSELEIGKKALYLRIEFFGSLAVLQTKVKSDVLSYDNFIEIIKAIYANPQNKVIAFDYNSDLNTRLFHLKQHRNKRLFDFTV